MAGAAKPYLNAGARPDLPALTGLRALAALAAIVWHAGYYVAFRDRLGPLYLGVDLFFLLSGFILTYVHGDEPGDPLRRHARFMALRLARIWPAYAVAMLAVVALAALAIALNLRPAAPVRAVLPEFPAYFFMLQSWIYAFPSVFNLPAWSVSAEFLAYLLFPLFLATAGRWRSPGASLCAVVACFCAGVAALVLLGAGDLNVIGPPGLVRLAFEFGMGVALCRFWRSGAADGFSWRWLVPATALAIMAYAVIAAPLARDLAIVALMPILLVGLAELPAGPARLLASRPMVFLGEISYAVYLVHYPVLQHVHAMQALLPADLPASLRGPWLVLPVTLCLSILLGWLLNIAVERPCRRWVRERMESRTT